MKSFVVVASLVLELVGEGQNDSPSSTNVSDNALGFLGLRELQRFLFHFFLKLKNVYKAVRKWDTGEKSLPNYHRHFNII